jgi:peptidyl-prolyl cis-trans isomerase A (cyclophilin A)
VSIRSLILAAGAALCLLGPLGCEAPERNARTAPGAGAEQAPTGAPAAGAPAGQSAPDPGTPAKGGNPVVVLRTELGEIKLELYPEKAPVSVENFLEYVDARFYDGTVFHRVVPNFVIQGGGMTKDGTRKPTRAPIKNEAENGLRNRRGTLAMARTQMVDSATSQFFINLKDNDFLDNGERDFGYAVFGRVISGMEVVDEIAKAGADGKVEVREAVRAAP